MAQGTAAVEKALRLQQDANTAKDEAISDLLAQRETIDVQLRTLGHVERKKNPCSVCKSTEHDARFHKGERKTAQS